jgi:PTH1 family peptidyl-tRNA hydrolase
MNRSGLIFPQLLKKSRAELADVVVVCDNMDLECGRIRLRRGGSHAGHNGIKSIMSHTGGADFLRIYVGIGRPAPWVSVVDHVLGAPEGQESEDMKQGVFRAAAALSRLLEGEDEQKVMNEFNRTGPS